MKWFVVVIIFVGVIAVFIWPVCKAIPPEALDSFNIPIEKRSTERGMVWKTWQFKEGNWYQCKSRFERFGFN